MPVKTPRELFVALLSDLRQGTEKATKFYQEANQVADDPQIKQSLEARAMVSEGILSKIDQCFKLMREKPVEFSGRLQEVFLEDFRTELSEIQSPVAKRLFVLAKLHHHTQRKIGEYVALIAMSDVSGHHGVGMLLESCLGDKLAFVERTRRLLRHAAEARLTERAAGA